MTREVYVDFFPHVIKKEKSMEDKIYRKIPVHNDTICTCLCTFYCEHTGFVSRLLLRQRVFIIYNTSCQVSFLKKAAEMFSLLIFKNEKLYWHIEA